MTQRSTVIPSLIHGVFHRNWVWRKNSLLLVVDMEAAMIWFQAAFDPVERMGRPTWVVLRMAITVDGVVAHPIARYSTRHEAEGHTRKNWEKLGR